MRFRLVGGFCVGTILLIDSQEQNRYKQKMTFNESQFSQFLSAVKFSAHKHRNQRRKGAEASPYINHPITVAELLWRIGKVTEMNILAAAILHDTLEDTDTTPEELENLFGREVLSLVLECTDDKRLPKAERKRLQILNAAHKSPGAKQIKLADKISNVTDITENPPADWSLPRRLEYLDWAEQVIAGLRGANAELEQLFDLTVKAARAQLKESL